MAYPTGTGTEVLKRTTINAQADTATSFRWDGTMASTGTSSYTVPALHIITVLSIIVCDQADAVDHDSWYIYDGANNIYLLQSQEIAAQGTFVWDDRFVLIGGDKLVVNSTGSANHDYSCHYIDQDWS